jgi:hypothetical protein
MKFELSKRRLQTMGLGQLCPGYKRWVSDNYVQATNDGSRTIMSRLQKMGLGQSYVQATNDGSRTIMSRLQKMGLGQLCPGYKRWVSDNYVQATKDGSRTIMSRLQTMGLGQLCPGYKRWVSDTNDGSRMSRLQKMGLQATKDETMGLGQLCPGYKRWVSDNYVQATKNRSREIKRTLRQSYSTMMINYIPSAICRWKRWVSNAQSVKSQVYRDNSRTGKPGPQYPEP